MTYEFISKYIESKGIDTLCSACYTMTMYDIIGYDIIFDIIEHDYGIKLKVHYADNCNNIIFEEDIENESELKNVIDRLIKDTQP